MTPSDALAALRVHAPLSIAERRAALGKLVAALRARAPEMVAAAAADYGRHSEMDTLLADNLIVQDAAKHARRWLGWWARWRGQSVPYPFWPARAWVEPMPKGVVGIMAPWNYPFQLALMPAVDALAAGNRIVVKPSEFTPRCAALLAEILATLGDDVARVVQGDATVAADFAAQPWDHLVFTGGTDTGRRVAAAAAPNLTPLTLELGGKCHAIVAPGADLARAAKDILVAKMINAGQTCVAPDTVLLVGHPLQEFIAAARAARLGPGETEVVNDAQRERLVRLTEGATLTALPGGIALAEAPEGHPMHASEIFGPVLALRACASMQDATRIVAIGDAPLAVYLFGATRDEEALVAGFTRSGAIVTERAVEFAAFHAVPFGGVGASGYGRRGGRAGFMEFSNLRLRVRHGRWAMSRMFDAPRTEKALSMARRLVGIKPKA
ncbi:MAG: aldehyde dehydrogenase family protein [Alphaproteobacteria bacterium]|nr:aldehyde dehydrogenase family protein [Alphaproteobacteria bacterium]